MMCNPRYGRIGLLVLPYYLVFELLAPVVELSGVIVVPVALAIGAVNLAFLFKFTLATYGFACVVSLIAIAADEYAHHRYPRWRDLGSAILGAITENLGYRQLIAWWCLQGLGQALRGGRREWGTMTRTGFVTAASAEPATSVAASQAPETIAPHPAVEAPAAAIPQRAPQLPPDR
jgi:hypothetical protein